MAIVRDLAPALSPLITPKLVDDKLPRIMESLAGYGFAIAPVDPDTAFWPECARCGKPAQSIAEGTEIGKPVYFCGLFGACDD